MELRNDARISSDTYGNGNAYKVTITTQNLMIDGSDTSISSYASSESTGYVGSIVIQADTITLMNSGEIRISAFQTLTDDQLVEMPRNSITIHAQELHLDQASRITAESYFNVPAGAIFIQASKNLIENGSSITTASQDADGGPITTQIGSLFLQNAFITTSVEGDIGDGGNITIQGIYNGEIESTVDVLVLKNGFIQANTGADEASGGNININVSAVIADAEGKFQVGGEERQGFLPDKKLNIIQAAAPGGEQGTINITAPKIDVSSVIANTSAYFANPAQLATNPCLAVNNTESSTLIQGSRGGIPEGPEDPATLFFRGERLDRLLNEDKRDE